MTPPDEERYALGRPPILAIVIGLVHAVAGGVVTLPCAAYGFFLALLGGSLALRGLPVFTGSVQGHHILLVFIVIVALVSLAACTCTSGLWLLRGHPRGRRWTTVLACVGILCTAARVAWTLTNPSQSGPGNTWVLFGVELGSNVELGLMAYCLFVLIMMYVPSVRRFYATPEQTAETEDSPA